MRYKSWAVCGLFLTSFIGCGPASSRDEAESASALHYITVSPNVSGLTAAVKKEKLRICLIGTTDDRWKDDIIRSTLQWVEPLRALTSDQLVKTIDILFGAQSGCDAEVNVRALDRAYTLVSQRPVVHMNKSGYYGSYNVLLHEMGHAFALGDTYIPTGVSGQCQSGQPQSVMCNTKFSELQEDDIAGLKVIYKRVFPNDTPPTTNDPKPQTTRVTMFVAIGAAVAVDRYDLRFSAFGDEAESGEMSYCFGALDACKAGTSWIKARKLAATGKSKMFGLAGPGGVDLTKSTDLVVRHSFEGRTSYRVVRFERSN